MALTQMGKPNNIALCGVALTDEHIRLIKTYNGIRPLRFMLALDGQTDKAGKDYRPEVEKALWKAVNALLPVGRFGSCRGHLVARMRGKWYNAVSVSSY